MNQVVEPYATGLDATGHTLDDLFPVIDPEFKPFGSRVLLQLRRVFNQSKGGIILVKETKDAEAWNTQVAKVIAMGPLAFKRRDTAEEWPEGMWAQIGDFVRVPRWNGDRWSKEMPDGGNPVGLVLLNDSDLLGQFTGDVLKVKAFIE